MKTNSETKTDMETKLLNDHDRRSQAARNYLGFIKVNKKISPETVREAEEKAVKETNLYLSAQQLIKELRDLRKAGKDE